jgi:beta-carotene 15,15'-dioxygenase
VLGRESLNHRRHSVDISLMSVLTDALPGHAVVDRPRRALGELRAPVAFAGTTAVVMMSLLGWSPSPMLSLLIAVAAVVAGMPHGALDVVLGPRMFGSRRFFPAYGALAALVVAGWVASPAIALVAFLAASWAHFGLGDTHDWPLGAHAACARAAATGGLVLGMPLAAHPRTVAPIFDALLLGRGAFSVSDARLWGAAMLVVAVPAAAASMVMHVRSRQWDGAAELLLLAALGATTAPLVAFAVYFALWHSPRHLVAARATKEMLTPTIAASVATVAAAAAAWVVLRPTAETAAQVVFIGLAALTLPHLLVTAVLHRRR